MYKVILDWHNGTLNRAMDFDDYANTYPNRYPDGLSLEQGRIHKLFTTFEKAVEAGNAYCDRIPSSPVYGAPGFHIEET